MQDLQVASSRAKEEETEMVRDILRSLKVTFSHLFAPKVTVQYPDEPVKVSPRFRGRHILRRWEDGKERCIACHLCSAACPADAITVIAEDNPRDNPVSRGERYAKVYQIDLLRCIFCGYCEDACPVNAIVLGSGFEISGYRREDFIVNKEDLLEPHPNSFVKDSFFDSTLYDRPYLPIPSAADREALIEGRQREIEEQIRTAKPPIVIRPY
ncbi:MAG: NADH-quinone oxidoreductase subunit NuoI [Armatimonadetes bacterium]|nr:NADH-quinone oxidoreductase subunit NuoI [Armatimonadota bacterium]